ncbi:nuclear transport factor 2 family protein [Kribbella sp. NPDC049227]|uniref:nuclear transport factor 2 family protein n=1 Tax=Kribbella sp. NPDC049227 TaxID=3364113 RepID=UPI003719E824
MSELSAREFVADFFDSFTREVVARGDAEAAVDRYYTPDVEQTADGVTLDRQRLVAHLRPIRKNLLTWEYDVHEAIRTADRLAARFTIHARLRQGRTISTEVYLFGELAPDGRMRRTTQATRDVTAR